MRCTWEATLLHLNGIHMGHYPSRDFASWRFHPKEPPLWNGRPMYQYQQNHSKFADPPEHPLGVGSCSNEKVWLWPKRQQQWHINPGKSGTCSMDFWMWLEGRMKGCLMLPSWSPVWVSIKSLLLCTHWKTMQNKRMSYWHCRVRNELYSYSGGSVVALHVCKCLSSLPS